MEVPFSPDEQARIDRLASATGRGAKELVREVVTEYLNGLDESRSLLDSRFDDIKSGRVKPMDGEEAFVRLRRMSQEHRAARS